VVIGKRCVEINNNERLREQNNELGNMLYDLYNLIYDIPWRDHATCPALVCPICGSSDDEPHADNCRYNHLLSKAGAVLFKWNGGDNESEMDIDYTLGIVRK